MSVALLDICLLFLACALVCGLVYGLVYLVVRFIRSALRKSQRKKVWETSNILAQIPTVNAKQSFADIPAVHCCRRYLNSKSSFDKFDPCEAVLEDIEEQEAAFQNWCEAASANEAKWRAYVHAINQLGPSQYDKDTLVAVERELVAEAMLQPVQNICLEVAWSYTSPQGRNHYADSRRYYRDDIQSMIEELRQRREERETRAYHIKRERALMTDSLRYDIMHRDGFRCQICGSEQSDGVKLHVDHIVPVSRGGRTEPSNLRTLCDRCNRGKRDKIES